MINSEEKASHKYMRDILLFQRMAKSWKEKCLLKVTSVWSKEEIW